MGVHGQSSNVKKNKQAKKRYTLGRQNARKKAIKKHGLTKMVGEIPNLDIVPESVITQRRKNSRTNVTISGKKKRKIMKQLKRLDANNKPKDVEMDDESRKTKKKQKKASDVEMADMETAGTSADVQSQKKDSGLQDSNDSSDGWEDMEDVESESD